MAAALRHRGKGLDEGDRAHAGRFSDFNPASIRCCSARMPGGAGHSADGDLREPVRDFYSDQRFRRDVFARGNRRLGGVQRRDELLARTFALARPFRNTLLGRHPGGLPSLQRLDGPGDDQRAGRRSSVPCRSHSGPGTAAGSSDEHPAAVRGRGHNTGRASHAPMLNESTGAIFGGPTDRKKSAGLALPVVQPSTSILLRCTGSRRQGNRRKSFSGAGADFPPPMAFRRKIERTSTRCILPLLDHPGGAGEDRWRHGKAERLGGLEIDDQLEDGRLLYRHISRLAPSGFSRARLPTLRKTAMLLTP